MATWRPVQILLLFLIAFGLSGRENHRLEQFQPANAGNAISAPRQSLPTPVHDEATCAFCQAAIFAPHAGSAAGILPLVWGAERRAHLSYDESVTHAGSTRPPRSRAPPSL